MDTTIKHADVKVKLTGFDGNAFSVLGRVVKALKAKGYGNEVDTFYAEATAGDYEHLLQTAARWVEVR